MNIKHLIKPVAVLAFVCGAPVLQAQVLGGNAGGGLGGSLGGTLGGGMGSVGGMGQGNGTGAIGGSSTHRRAASTTRKSRAPSSARVTTAWPTCATRCRARPRRPSGGTYQVSGAASSATNGIAGSNGITAGNASGRCGGSDAVPRMAQRRRSDLTGSLDSVKDAAPRQHCRNALGRPAPAGETEAEAAARRRTPADPVR